MDLLKEIGNARKIAIAGHIRPDGDCIGSCLAVYRYLSNALKDATVTVFIDENPPTIFGYLYGYDKMVQSAESDEVFDVIVIVDASSYDRLGQYAKYFDSAKKSINVDHHESNPGYCDVSEIRPHASSTCEVLFELFDKQYIDDEVAKALYTGMVHDSGVFQYNNMSKRSFEIVGELTTYDFDGSKIIDESFYQKTYHQNQILGRALLESILFMNGKCIVSVIDRKTMDFYQVLPKHFEGIVNQLKYTKGVEVAIFMYELKAQSYKVSMRSNGGVNVAKIAVHFGGGGHDRAAGVEMNGTFHDVINALSEQIEIQLKENGII